jgi:hypothetical protein
MGLTHALTAGNRRGFIAMVVAGVFALSGVGVIAYAATHQVHPPQAPLAEVVTTPTISSTPTTSATATAGATGSPTDAATQVPGSAVPAPAPKKVGPVMSRSEPIALSIPAINVKSSGMLHLGQTAQGSLQVPPPGPDYNKVAWYRNSPTPGELGPAVLVGHIDSAAEGPSVFFYLGDLRAGNLIRVTRADKSVAVFKVDDVKRFHKTDFPTKLVYSNTDHAALRIITCGGPFDRDSGSYIDNTVVLASLIK